MVDILNTLINLFGSISSKPRKNDEITSKLPEYGDCLLSTTLFP